MVAELSTTDLAFGKTPTYGTIEPGHVVQNRVTREPAVAFYTANPGQARIDQ